MIIFAPDREPHSLYTIVPGKVNDSFISKPILVGVLPEFVLLGTLGIDDLPSTSIIVTPSFWKTQGISEKS